MSGRPRQRDTKSKPANHFRGRTPKPKDESPRLPGVHEDYDFLFAVHPDQWDVVIVDGKAEVLPRLIALKGRAGLDGCTNKNDVAQRFPVYENRGFIRVPDRPVQAFGETVDSYRAVFDIDNGDPDKTPPTHITTAWRRPRMYGGRVTWDHDAEGELAFRREIKAEIFDNEVPSGVLDSLRADLEALYETSLDGRKSVQRVLQTKLDGLKAAAEAVSA